MAKTKTTKLDKEIQEGLYDPKREQNYNIYLKGKKYGTVKAKTLDEAKRKAWMALGISYKVEVTPAKKEKHFRKEQKRHYDPKGTRKTRKEMLNKFAKYIYSIDDYNKLNTTQRKEVHAAYKAYQTTRKWSGTEQEYDPTPSVSPRRWYEAMVKGIKRSSDVRNPYAIVRNIWAKLSPSKKAEIKRREAKGERFKYDLPLPVDKPTRGTGTVRMVKPFKLAEVQVNLSVKDYLSALKSGIFSRMKRQDGTTALVARCKSPEKNVNIFVDKAGKK